MDPKDVTAVLSQAVKAVADAAVPADLKSLAFDKAVDLLSRKPSAAVGVQAALTSRRDSAGGCRPRDPSQPILRRTALRSPYSTRTAAEETRGRGGIYSQGWTAPLPDPS
jgi:hypothetical protein